MGKKENFLGLGFHPIFSINVAFGWFIGFFFHLTGAKITNSLIMWLKILLSYMCSGKLGSEGDLSVCCFEISGSSNHDQFKIGELYRVKMEDGDMQRPKTFPRNQSWLVTSSFDGCCKVTVSPWKGVRGKFPI